MAIFPRRRKKDTVRLGVSSNIYGQGVSVRQSTYGQSTRDIILTNVANERLEKQGRRPYFLSIIESGSTKRTQDYKPLSPIDIELIKSKERERKIWRNIGGSVFSNAVLKAFSKERKAFFRNTKSERKLYSDVRKGRISLENIKKSFADLLNEYKKQPIKTRFLSNVAINLIKKQFRRGVILPSRVKVRQYERALIRSLELKKGTYNYLQRVRRIEKRARISVEKSRRLNLYIDIDNYLLKNPGATINEVLDKTSIKSDYGRQLTDKQLRRRVRYRKEVMAKRIREGLSPAGAVKIQKKLLSDLDAQMIIARGGTTIIYRYEVKHNITGDVNEFYATKFEPSFMTLPQARNYVKTKILSMLQEKWEYRPFQIEATRDKTFPDEWRNDIDKTSLFTVIPESLDVTDIFNTKEQKTN